MSSPVERKRYGSEKDVPVGSAKSTIGATHPQVDSLPVPGAPGEIIYSSEPIPINTDLEVTKIQVVNKGDRPITVGSHYHFAEANPALEFDRQAAWGKRQNIIAGGMVRFEPGDVQDVELVPFGGRRIAAGFRGECGGYLDD